MFTSTLADCTIEVISSKLASDKKAKINDQRAIMIIPHWVNDRFLIITSLSASLNLLKIQGFAPHEYALYQADGN